MKGKYMIPFVLVISTLVACSDQLLNLEPISEITVGNFYRTPEDIRKAVNAVYAGMKSWPVNIYLYLSEVRSKNFIGVYHDAQRDWWDITAFSIRPEANILRTTWQELYRMINHANEVLARIDNVAFENVALRERYKAEVRFLRAFAYFHLVRLWGRVPLITSPVSPEEALKIGQSEPVEIYDFIVKEMEASLPNLPLGYENTQDIGRVTRLAAEGILARVYLTMSGYPVFDNQYLNRAKQLLEDVISYEGSYVRWCDDYAEMFKVQNENTCFLFEIQFISGGQGAGTSLPAQILPSDINTQYVPFGAQFVWASRLALSDDLLNSYEAGDKRFAATITTEYLTNSNPPDTGRTPFYSKFLDVSVAQNAQDNYDWEVNFPLLRYADVLLMYAEVLTLLNNGVPTSEAISIINRIRERAGLPPIYPSADDWLSTLERERRHEFAAEGLYWFDLVRWGIAVDVMNRWFQETGQNIVIDEHDLVYPIPQSEIDIYPGLYQQNPGY